jgi:hypothetical protein
VMEREDPVHPASEPAVAGEELLATAWVRDAFDIVVDEDGERGVRYAPAILEAVSLGCSHKSAVDT